MSRTVALMLPLLGALLLAHETLRGAAVDGQRTWHVAREISTLRLYQQMSPAIEFSEVRIKEGDDLQWSRTDWDDRSWRVVASGRHPPVPTGAGVLWLRFRVRWNAPEGRLPAGLHLWSLKGSYDLYWDGNLLRHSGVPGNSPAEEQEGASQNTLGIPENLLDPGEHVVAMRLSTHHAISPRPYSVLRVIMSDPVVHDLGFRRLNLLPVMAVGGLLTVALGSFVMWVVVARQRSLLLLAGLCFFAGGLEGLAWFSLGYAYPYSWSYGLNVGVAAAALVVSLLLGAIVVEEWCLPRGGRLMGGLLAVDLALAAGGSLPEIGYLPQLWIGTALGFVLLCSAWAMFRRKHGARVVGAVVLLSGALLAMDPVHFIGTDFFQEFLPTILGLVFAIAFRLRSERRQVQEMKLAASRLEVELLKKSLQPHFLMNTLTALAQTVEENPRRAVQLIGDLAEEFRSLARMSGERHVPLERELELCRAHLRVMRARTDVDWQLVTEGIDPAARVPPALFLTLIENGFTHQKTRGLAPSFRLRADPTRDGVVYRFHSPGTILAGGARTDGGTGLRYVHARLQESFYGAWRLEQGAVPDGWETVIELRSVRQRGGRS